MLQHLQAQYDQLVPSLCNEHPDIFPPELYTWNQFLWACELWYSNGMKIMFPDGELRTCLIPIAGFLNHSVCLFLLPLFSPSRLFVLIAWINLAFPIHRQHVEFKQKKSTQNWNLKSQEN